MRFHIAPTDCATALAQCSDVHGNSAYWHECEVNLEHPYIFLYFRRGGQHTHTHTHHGT